MTNSYEQRLIHKNTVHNAVIYTEIKTQEIAQ